MSLQADEPPLKRPRLSNLDGADEMDEDLPANATVTAKENSGSNAITEVAKDPADAQLQKEQNVGITESISPNITGFQGTMKQRYTDFIVNEVLPSGEILHLTELRPQTTKALPQAPEPQLNDAAREHVADGVNEQTTNGQDARGDVHAEHTDDTVVNGGQGKENEKAVEVHLSEDDRAILSSVLNDQTIDAVVTLYMSILKQPDQPPRKFDRVTSEPLESREGRTKLHKSVRTIFKSKLETETLDNNVIVFTAAQAGRNTFGNARPRPSGSDQRGPRKRGAPAWQDFGGEYIHFTLYKENKDTMEAIYFLASQMKVAVKRFQFAGTKDRRAVTVQRASAYRVHAKELFVVGQRLKYAKIGGFEYRPYGLELGDANGNEFTISLRDCRFPGDEELGFEARLAMAKDMVSSSLMAFAENGFINYYGLQRFGSFSTGTHVVGTKLLQGNYKAAVDAILDFNPELLNAGSANNKTDKVSSDDINRAAAINIWRTEQNSRKALDKLPRKFSAELTLIQSLDSRDREGKLHQINNFAGALGIIPRNLRLMYIHAYQSLVWNHVAGERWKLYGSRVVEGDLVIVDKQAVRNEEPEVDDAGEVIIRPGPEEADPFERARPLSAFEAESGNHTICDIVLPTPGYDVVYPHNPINDVYKTFMASPRGGGLDPTKMRRDWKELSLSGAYRKVLARPAPGMTAEVKSYTSDSEQLAETDMDRINALKKSAGGQLEGPADKPVVIQAEGKEGEIRKIAVVVKMQLGSSQYATMALREFMGKGGCKAYKPDYGGGR
ncbi:MAG: hypothetical protein M1828_001608 [Chrysothrix sp. TS-e1954]|nr:MAG: hypothetical protein M1828_001608 [Chrysothrix sp. TS-e1954]